MKWYNHEKRVKSNYLRTVKGVLGSNDSLIDLIDKEDVTAINNEVKSRGYDNLTDLLIKTFDKKYIGDYGEALDLLPAITGLIGATIGFGYGIKYFIDFKNSLSGISHLIADASLLALALTPVAYGIGYLRNRDEDEAALAAGSSAIIGAFPLAFGFMGAAVGGLAGGLIGGALEVSYVLLDAATYYIKLRRIKKRIKKFEEYLSKKSNTLISNN